MSDHFYVSNGVRQGGILSPKLYSVYVDDLSDYLVKSQIECHIDNVCVNIYISLFVKRQKYEVFLINLYKVRLII